MENQDEFSRYIENKVESPVYISSEGVIYWKSTLIVDGRIEFTKEQEELMEMFDIGYSWDTAPPST